MKIVRYKELNLAGKTASAIGGILFFIFAVFIVITVLLASRALMDSTDGQFNNMSEKNALKAQEPITIASSTAKDMESYLERMLQVCDNMSAAELRMSEKELGSVFQGIKLKRIYREIEDYLINTLKTVVHNNDDIMGGGVLFEPNQFDPAIRDYSFYISEDDADNPYSLGIYEDYSKAVYYTGALESKKPYFTSPYKDDKGISKITASYPVLWKENVVGVVCLDINVSNFEKIVEVDDRYPSMYQDILTNEGIIVFDSSDLSGVNVGINMSDWMQPKDVETMHKNFEKKVPFIMSDKNKSGVMIERYFYPITAGDETWWSLIGFNKDEKYADVVKMITAMIIISIAALIILITSVVLILLRNIKPIGKVVDAAEMIAAGKFDIELSSNSQDEIGILTRSFEKTVTMLKTVISDITSVLNEMAQGHLDTEPSVEYVGDLKEVETSANSILYNLNEVLRGIYEASEQVSGGSSQIATGAQALAEGATDQASSIQELQATITDLSSKVEKNAESAKDANELAKIAGEELQQGNGKMQEMLKAMEEINRASGEIKSILSTIEEIASQTNLLSLNASIEAARAGEAGKGFAVVAAQIGKLAADSSEATKLTADLIQVSIKAVENGFTIAGETAKAIEGSVEKVKEVVLNVKEISAATSSQSQALDQVTQGVEQISCVIEENSAMAEESASSAQELSAQAALMNDLVSKFRLK